jgi:hypothetical protein
MARAVGALIVVLYIAPASAAVVGQTISVDETTMACPSVAALGRFRKLSEDDPARASTDARAEGCQEINPSNQGMIDKVAGANVCVLFSAEGGGCLWIAASAASGRIDPNQNPRDRPAAPTLSGVMQGVGKFFGF